MFRKAFLLFFIISFLSLLLPTRSVGVQFGISITKTVKANPNEFIVNPGDSIQDAVDMASPGDVVSVASGTYYEHVVINKALTLKGAGSSDVFIDGSGENEAIISVSASNVEISGFTIQNGSKTYEYPYGGIQILHSENVTVRNNVIQKNYYGVFLSTSNFSNIIENVIIEDYDCGIKVSDSSYNHVVANNIMNNPTGIWITSEASKNNTVYRNNFINNNSSQATLYSFSTRWDNCAEGNYWDDYVGMDANGDGIGDTPYPDQYGWDEYPLMEQWNVFRRYMVIWNEQIHNVTTHCNSTLASFKFNQSEKQISFNVTGPSGTFVFCNVTIPKILLNASSGSWTVFLEDTNMTNNISVAENATHTSIYLTYTFPPSTRNIRIIGTDAIPEFAQWAFLLMFVIATIAITVMAKKPWLVKRANSTHT